jgi:hypothetical protein
MAPLPDVPNVLRLAMQWTLGGSSPYGIRVFFGYGSGTPSISDCNTIADEAGTSWSSHFASLTAEDVVLVAAQVRDLSSTSGAFSDNTLDVAGTHDSPIPTAGAAVIVSHKVLRHYRGGKPKTFLPSGTVADKASEQDWAGSFTSAIDSAWDAFTSDITALSLGVEVLTQVNVTYYPGYNAATTLPSGKVKQTAKLRTTPLVDQITGHVVDSRIGSQRRRRGKSS